MLPYTHGLLRCDPAWSQLARPTAANGALRTKSCKVLEWKCAECDAVYAARVDHNHVSTGRCKEHARRMHSRTRERYDGAFDADWLRPVRAGLLRGVARGDIAAILEARGVGPAEARACVDEVYDGGYTRAQLLDSMFWGPRASHDLRRSRRLPPPEETAAAAAAGRTEGEAEGKSGSH